MIPDRLLQHFDRISEAPDAIPSLRRFILDLAVRGKLAPQDPNDEPAAELLRRISVKKAELNGERKLGRADPMPRIAANQVSSRLPDGWAWSRLGDVITLVSGQHLLPNEYSDIDQSGLPYVTGPADFGTNGLIVSRYALVRKAVARQGELLLTVKGSGVGKTAICDIPSVAISRQLMALNAIGWNQRFLLITTHLLAQELRKNARSLIPGISRDDVILFAFGLPPLAEQHRIVAQVDELMALCDQLEAAKDQREQRRDRLAAASLTRLSQPANGTEESAEAFRNHARFVFTHLPRLSTRFEHIKQLRQTILNLAVRGYLSKQLDGDGHANELIDRITKHSSKKREPARNEADELAQTLPHLPESWIWVIVNEVAAHTDNAITDGPFGANLKTSHYVTAPGYRVIRLQNIGHGRFRDEYRSYIGREHFQRLAKHHVEPGDLIVAGLVDPSVRCCEVPQDIGPALVKADCYRFRVHAEVCSRFALHYLNSPVCQHFAAAHHHGMTLIRIGLGNFRQIPFPLPPLAEQHRIVAKVDELMVLCDQLEAQLSINEKDNRRLLEAVLDEALNGAR